MIHKTRWILIVVLFPPLSMLQMHEPAVMLPSHILDLLVKKIDLLLHLLDGPKLTESAPRS